MSSVKMSADQIENMLEIIKKRSDEGIKKRLKAGEYRMLVRETNDKSRATETYYQESGGQYGAVPEQTDIPLQGGTEGFTKRRYAHKFGGGAGFSKEVMELAKKDVIRSTTKDLMDAPYKWLDTQVALWFYFADGLTAVPKVNNIPVVDIYTADGKPAFALDHGYKTSGQYTYANRTAAYMAPTADSIFAVSNMVKYWRLQDGDYVNADIERFLFSPMHEKKVFELFASDDNSETTNRGTNPIRARYGKMAYKILRRGIDPTTWYGETNWENDLILNWIWKPSIERDYRTSNQTHYMYSSMMNSLGAGDLRRFVKVAA